VSEYDGLVPGLDIPENPPESKDQLTCFCCGVCCHYRVFMTLEEAQRISNDRGIALEDFLELTPESLSYGQEHFWFGAESYLLKQEDGFCVFLTAKEGTNGWFCGIHHVKPEVCRNWVSTFHRPECQKGLALRWNLSLDEATGIIRGPEEQLQKFDVFMEKLRNGAFFE
jgi:Fe-S-cluster containining protein